MPTPTYVDGRCPRCDSPHPHLHPAVQAEGEVQPCYDPYHEQVTTQNTPAKIERHLAMRGRMEGV